MNEIVAMAGILTPVAGFIWQMVRHGNAQGRIESRLDGIEKAIGEVKDTHKACRAERVTVETDLYRHVGELRSTLDYHRGVTNGRKGST